MHRILQMNPWENLWSSFIASKFEYFTELEYQWLLVYWGYTFLQRVSDCYLSTMHTSEIFFYEIQRLA